MRHVFVAGFCGSGTQAAARALNRPDAGVFAKHEPKPYLPYYAPEHLVARHLLDLDASAHRQGVPISVCCGVGFFYGSPSTIFQIKRTLDDVVFVALIRDMDATLASVARRGLLEVAHVRAGLIGAGVRAPERVWADYYADLRRMRVGLVPTELLDDPEDFAEQVLSL